MHDFLSSLQIDTGLVRKILVSFLCQEIERTGLDGAVVGVSGGVDSSLSCFLCAQALGPQKVLAVLMPYRTSSPDSLRDAEEIVRLSGVRGLTVEITPMVEALLAKFPEADQRRRGNIMARARMIVLYDQSAAQGKIVVGTGNKTEILLGYTTLYGDSACGLNPIGDLYKNQVRQLARAVGVPDHIVAKAPTADLWQGQTDEGELGFTYDQVDQLLYLLVDERYSPAECVEAGFDRAFVGKVVERVRQSQFKRVPAPIAKLSNRTIGYDFLYLRDWGT
ncbi:MAG: NAD+ synthase [Anaerolineales bacterium]|jgi:NAD+ synthase